MDPPCQSGGCEAGVRVEQVTADQTAAIIGAYLTTTPELGAYIRGPADLFQQLWFVNTRLAFSTRTPSVQTIEAGGWNAGAPLFAVLQAAGLPGFDMPSVDPGVFAPAASTSLQVVAFAADPWSLTPQRRRDPRVPHG